MLSEFRKSINYIIYERTTSPFWGAFIFSWLICNWKIVFTVFVVSEDKLSLNKIDYISYNFINWKPIALYPFISTLILVGIFPLLSNGAYWITIIYSKWRLDKRNEVEKKTLLSIEQSIEIRQSIIEKEAKFSSILNDKESEIKTLNLQIATLNEELTSSSNVLIENLSKNEEKQKKKIWDEDYTIFANSSQYRNFEDILVDLATKRNVDYYNSNASSLTYFESFELIEKHGNEYILTDKGKYFSKLFHQNRY